MRVGIVAILGTIGGPRDTLINEIRHLSQADRKNQYVVFCDTKQPIRDVPNIEIVEVTPYHDMLSFYWEQVLVPFTIKRKKIDIVYHSKNVVPFLKFAKYITNIHDMAPFLMPKTFSPLRRWYIRLNIPLAAKWSDKIITGSESAKRDIVRILKVPERKVDIIHPGIGEHYRIVKDKAALKRIKEKYRLPNRFFLYVGTIQPRKNIAQIVRALAGLRDEELMEQLVIVGRPGWEVSRLKQLVNRLRLHLQVRFVFSVPDEDLLSIYNLATVFVYPSFYEGFGKAIVEAMACGVPVIASNTSSIPEVVGNAGILVHPKDRRGLQEAMKKLLQDKALYMKLRKKGLEKVKEYGWERHMESFFRIFEELGPRR